MDARVEGVYHVELWCEAPDDAGAEVAAMYGENGRSVVVRSSTVRLRVKGGDEDLVPPVGQSQLGMAPVR